MADTLLIMNDMFFGDIFDYTRGSYPIFMDDKNPNKMRLYIISGCV